MSCPTFDNLLESLADDPALEPVREHVEACPACRQSIGRVRAVFRHAALYEEFLAGASQKMPSRWARSIAKRVHAAFEAQFAARPTCPSREELFDWLTGNAECDPATGAHLAMCISCQQAMGEVAALLHGASQWDVVTAPPAPTADEPMPIDLSDRVFATVNAAYEERFAARPREVVTTRETTVRPARRLPRFATTALAAAAALLVAVGGVVWQARNPEVARVDVANSDETSLPSKPNETIPAIVRADNVSVVPVVEAAATGAIDWPGMAQSVLAGGAQLQRRAEPWLTLVRQAVRTPTSDDWAKVANDLVARAKQARQRGQFGEEQRHLVDTLAAARAGHANAARKAAYGLLLVRNQLDQNRPDAALAAYEELPPTDAAEVRKARLHLAGRLAKAFHDRGRSAMCVLVLSALENDLDASGARTLADARRAVATQTTRLVGTGNQALTRKVERWAQTRLAGSLAQATR